jgi:uncharacterized protein YjbJ (UPF0337 family)
MDKDRVAGAAKTVVGNVKEAFGKLVGDQKTIAEGQANQKVGKAQNALGGLRRPRCRKVEVALHVSERRPRFARRPHRGGRARRTQTFEQEHLMTKHLPSTPTANRSGKGPGDKHEVASDTTHAKHPDDLNTSEQGDTANIKQNTTNKGYFRGRRMK